MFNNNNTIPPSTVNETSGLYWTLDLRTRKATLDKALTDPAQPLYVPSQGTVIPMPNGNTFMGYGAIPIMKEYIPSGAVAMTVQFGDLTNMNAAGAQTQSYRAYRIPWRSVPAADPVAVVENGKVYMSKWSANFLFATAFG
jgi:hypothetical protein